MEEPYCLLEDEGYEFGLPPSVEDYRALLARSVQCLTAPPLRSAIIFDRTPLDYLAYLAAAGAEPCSGPSPAPTHRLPHRTWPPGRLTRE